MGNPRLARPPRAGVGISDAAPASWKRFGKRRDSKCFMHQVKTKRSAIDSFFSFIFPIFRKSTNNGGTSGETPRLGLDRAGGPRQAPPPPDAQQQQQPRPCSPASPRRSPGRVPGRGGAGPAERAEGGSAPPPVARRRGLPGPGGRGLRGDGGASASGPGGRRLLPGRRWRRRRRSGCRPSWRSTSSCRKVGLGGGGGGRAPPVRLPGGGEACPGSGPDPSPPPLPPPPQT